MGSCYSGALSETTASMPGSRGTRSWRMKISEGFLKKHKDSWNMRAIKEFEEFKDYCVKNGITLDMARVEKGKNRY